VRRQFPASGLVIVAHTIDAADLLEAMRMGVNEWVAEPLNLDELVAALQRVAQPATQVQRGRVLAVVGAKGGVGATTVAVNLATSLHRAAKQPTLLIDLHGAHGDAAVFLGAEPRFSVLDALENLQRMDETYLKSVVTPTKAGIDLLGSSSTVTSSPFDAGRVRSLIEFAATTYRYVVLDCPRSDATMLEALDSASQVVVLANQELTTIRNAGRIMAQLRQRCGTDRVKLAMSRMDPNAELAQSDIERVLGGPVKYVFPNDYRASSSAITRGEPLILQNHSRLASSLEEVAHDLSGLPQKVKDSNKAGLFGRLSTRR
jgi:pilus assembly protein CpaE